MSAAGPCRVAVSFRFLGFAFFTTSWPASVSHAGDRIFALSTTTPERPSHDGQRAVTTVAARRAFSRTGTAVVHPLLIEICPVRIVTVGGAPTDPIGEAPCTRNSPSGQGTAGRLLARAGVPGEASASATPSVRTSASERFGIF